MADPIDAITRAAVRRPWRFVLSAGALFAASLWLASGLELRSDLRELLPDDVASVAQVKEMIRRVGGDGTVYLNLEALDGPQGLPACERLAPVLAGELLALGKDVIRSVDSNIGPVQQWYEEHWPLFLSTEELARARDALRDQIKTRKAAANPLAVDLADDDEAAPGQEGKVAPPDPLLDASRPLPREEVRAKFSEYLHGFMANPDRRSLLLVVRPTGTSLGMTSTRALLDRVRGVIDAHQPELQRDHLRVGVAGSFALGLAEYESVVQDVFGTAVLVLALVLASILLFFRDLRSTVSLGVATLTAVAVTFAITRLAIGYLNMQTSFLGAIVLGNGINYGLIYLARVQQLRRQGVGLEEACVSGAHTTARATLLASAATSVSFGVLIIAANRGFRHFGFIGGIGMLLCWVATFSLVPALLALFERLRPVAAASGGSPLSLTRTLQRVFAAPGAIVAVFAVLTLAAAALALRALPHALERDLDNLTNDRRGQVELRRDQDRANQSLPKSILGSVALLPSREEADEFCDAVLERAKVAPYDRLVQGCDTISLVLPRWQREKLAIVRDLVSQLSDDVLARLPDDQRHRASAVRAELAAQRELTPADVPYALLDRFREVDGNVGRVAVVSASKHAQIGDGDNLQQFVAVARGVPVRGRTFDATGENAILADLLTNIETEGPRTTLLSFLGVCVLVLVFFRDLRTSAEVMGALFVGVILMTGVLAAIGLRVNFFNFVAYPITFGIAVDYGANVAARVRGRPVLEALAEVGPSVALCSWTTIVGYGSLLTSLNRALRSFAWYAMIGELTCLVTALLLLPALLLLARGKTPAGS